MTFGFIGELLGRAASEHSTRAEVGLACGELAATIGPILHALKWCVENDGECLGDHPKRLAAYGRYLASAQGLEDRALESQSEESDR